MNFSGFGKLNVTVKPFIGDVEAIRLKNLEPKFSFKEGDQVKGFDGIFEKKIDNRFVLPFNGKDYHKVKIKDLATNLFVDDIGNVLTYERKGKQECVIGINYFKKDVFNNLFMNVFTVPEATLKSMKNEDLLSIAKEEGKGFLFYKETEKPVEITAPDGKIYNIVKIKSTSKIGKGALMTYKVDVDDYLSMFKKTIIINGETLEPLVIGDKMVTNIEHKDGSIYIFTVEGNQNYEINLDRSTTIGKNGNRDIKEYNDRKLGIRKERNVDIKEYNDRLLGIKK